MRRSERDGECNEEGPRVLKRRATVRLAWEGNVCMNR